MDITYLIGIILSVVLILFGMVTKVTLAPAFDITVEFGNLIRFFDPASILITIGCTLAVVVASFPSKMLRSVPKHFKILLNTKRFDPLSCVEQLVELAQIARKNGLLSLEEKANEKDDPFFRQAIMLIVDAYDPDKVKAILENDIECMSSRHDDVAGMYEKASSVAPAFGMVGTLVGLINMLRSMDMTSASSSIGSDMGTALITTLYGCILAHVFFSPIAANLRTRDEEEVLCKRVIVEGIISIQSGENPKFLREKLLTFMEQQQREATEGFGEKTEKRRGKKSK